MKADSFVDLPWHVAISPPVLAAGDELPRRMVVARRRRVKEDGRVAAPSSDRERVH